MAKGRGHRHGQVKKDVYGDFPQGKRQWTPLSTGFMVASIIGFFASVLYVAQKFSLKIGVAFAVVFACMFIASIISMDRASPDAQLAIKPIK